MLVGHRSHHRRRVSLLYDHRVRRSHKKYCGLTRKEILTILSCLALPLMLGIFTVVISFDQKNLAAHQRLEDRRLADQEREQDLNISREQRREDRESSREQRLQDLNQSILQRELERTIANETHNISLQGRKHELELHDKHYRDTLLTNYIIEMSHLLEQNNGSLINNALTSTLSRLKTLTLIRQLDSNRNSQVIRFLYEANQLNSQNQSSIDLSDAELNGIDMSTTRTNNQMHYLYLVNVDLTNSSFVNRDLSESNFSSTTLINVNFSYTKLINIDLSYGIFDGSFNAYNSVIRGINFSYTNLTGIDFSKTRDSRSNSLGWNNKEILLYMNFNNADLTNTRFCGIHCGFIYFNGNLNQIDFSNAVLTDAIFECKTMKHLNFSSAWLVGNVTFLNLEYMDNISFFMTNFLQVIFSNINNTRTIIQNNDFNFAKLERSEFIRSYIEESSFINATIFKTIFSSCFVNNCNFINVTMSQVEFSRFIWYTNFDNAILQDDVTFLEYTTIYHSTFRRAQMQNLIAKFCDFTFVDMNGANLSNAIMYSSALIKCNLMNTDLSGADLSLVDLSHSNLLNARITDEQLYSALSIENCTLPNGTIAHDIPLIRNGNADCNKIIEQDWIVEPPNSIILKNRTTNKYDFNHQVDCLFAAVESSTTIVKMSQHINITRYKSVLNRTATKLRIKVECTDNVTICLIERNVKNEILHEWNIYDNYDITNANRTTTNIEIKLLFHMSNNNNPTCDNIEFKILTNCIMC